MNGWFRSIGPMEQWNGELLFNDVRLIFAMGKTVHQQKSLCTSTGKLWMIPSPTLQLSMWKVRITYVLLQQSHQTIQGHISVTSLSCAILDILYQTTTNGTRKFWRLAHLVVQTCYRQVYKKNKNSNPIFHTEVIFQELTALIQCKHKNVPSQRQSKSDITSSNSSFIIVFTLSCGWAQTKTRGLGKYETFIAVGN